MHTDDERERVRDILAGLASNPAAPGREKLLDELAVLHQGLITHIARRFTDRGEPLDDLIQVGMVALLKAAQRFDADQGVEFSTYLTPTVLGEIKRHFRDHAWSVKIPRRAQEIQPELTSATADFEQEHRRAPSVDELAEKMSLSREEVLTGLEAKHAYAALPLDAPYGQGGLAISEWMADPNNELDRVEWRRTLEPLLSQLPQREQEILRLRFADQMTQSQIASRTGVSQMHVSRLLAQALTKLRAQLDESLNSGP